MEDHNSDGQSQFLRMKNKCEELHRSGRYIECIVQMESLLNIMSFQYGDTHPETIEISDRLCEIMNLYSMLQLQSDNFDVAMEYLRKALELCNHSERLKATTYNNMACLSRRTGKLRSALTYLQSAFQIELRIGTATSLADTHLNLCAVLSQLDKHGQALEHSLLSVVFLQDELLQNTLRKQRKGISKKQIPSQTNQKQVEESIISEDRLAVLTIALHNLGVELEHLKRHEESMKIYNSALTFASENLGKNHQLAQNLQKVIHSATMLQFQKTQKTMKYVTKIRQRPMSSMNCRKITQQVASPLKSSKNKLTQQTQLLSQFNLDQMENNTIELLGTQFTHQHFQTQQQDPIRLKQHIRFKTLETESNVFSSNNTDSTDRNYTQTFPHNSGHQSLERVTKRSSTSHTNYAPDNEIQLIESTKMTTQPNSKYISFRPPSLQSWASSHRDHSAKSTKTINFSIPDNYNNNNNSNNSFINGSQTSKLRSVIQITPDRPTTPKHKEWNTDISEFLSPIQAIGSRPIAAKALFQDKGVQLQTATPTALSNTQNILKLSEISQKQLQSHHFKQNNHNLGNSTGQPTFPIDLSAKKSDQQQESQA